MFGECHAHVIMDGINYSHAVNLHKDGVNEDVIRKCFEQYVSCGVSFVRDGGDALGVSSRAKEIAPEYGIDYRSPGFAIHKQGCYGAIVGKSFTTLKEFHERVLEAKIGGADFIKIMTTGLLDFADHGTITGTPLDAAQVKEMVHIAHEEGFSVMSHTNGDYGVRAAIEAGADSIEHGNYMNEETISMLADSSAVWVPTLVTVRNLKGCGRFLDETLMSVIEKGEKNIKLAYKKKVKTALGSDGGAYMVPHGKGILDEYQAFLSILGDTEEIQKWLKSGENEIKKRFKQR